MSDPDQLLTELEALLHDEAQALMRLDRDAIERSAARKLELMQALDASARASETPRARVRRVERLRRRLIDNQLLIVHARDCVRGLIGAVTGDPGVYGESAPRARHDGVSLDVRG